MIKCNTVREGIVKKFVTQDEYNISPLNVHKLHGFCPFSFTSVCQWPNRNTKWKVLNHMEGENLLNRYHILYLFICILYRWCFWVASLGKFLCPPGRSAKVFSGGHSGGISPRTTRVMRGVAASLLRPAEPAANLLELTGGSPAISITTSYYHSNH